MVDYAIYFLYTDLLISAIDDHGLSDVAEVNETDTLAKPGTGLFGAFFASNSGRKELTPAEEVGRYMCTVLSTRKNPLKYWVSRSENSKFTLFLFYFDLTTH